eukprot:434082-Pleurochrysis_carterae.AAC.1
MQVFQRPACLPRQPLDYKLVESALQGRMRWRRTGAQLCSFDFAREPFQPCGRRSASQRPREHTFTNSDAFMVQHVESRQGSFPCELPSERANYRRPPCMLSQCVKMCQFSR